MKKKLFNWLFKAQIKEFEKQTNRCKLVEEHITQLIGATDIGIDVNSFERRYRAESWACISIQGKATDFIKFIHLGDQDINEIHNFLKVFENRNMKIDAPPTMVRFLKFSR